LGVGADCRDNLVGVVLDCAPVATATANRFVIDFIDDVRDILVLLGNLGEEVLGKACFEVGSVAVPVDNDIDVVFDSGLDHSVDGRKLAFRRLRVRNLVVQLVLGSAIGVVVFNTHGIAEHVNFEIVYNP